MRAKGDRAEQLALKYLIKQKLHPIECNYQTRSGEIDLIMRDQECLVFIEVRSKTSSRHGSPEESIDENKQARIIETARHYLHSRGLDDETPCRFDVVAISSGQINWLKDAFET